MAVRYKARQRRDIDRFIEILRGRSAELMEEFSVTTNPTDLTRLDYHINILLVEINHHKAIREALTPRRYSRRKQGL